MSSTQIPEMPLSVLVIEDDPGMAEIVLFGLAQANYQGSHIANVNLVIDLLRSKRFDAIICDINLSSKKSGIDLYFELVKLGLHSGPFLFMTGQTVNWAGFERSGNEKVPHPVVFFKPFSVSRLVSALNEHLRTPKLNFASLVAKPSQSLGHVAVPKSDELASLRHDLCNKVMIASENVNISLILLARSLASGEVATNESYAGIHKRILNSSQALKDVTELLETWSQHDGKDTP